MSINLVDTVARAIPPDVVDGLAHLLDENEWTIRRGLSAVIPVLLGGLATKAATPTGACSLLHAIDNPTLDPDLASHFASALAAGQHALLKQVGGAQLGSLFGADKAAALSRALSAITGMRASSANSLLTTTVPMMFGVLQRLVGEQRLDARGLSTLLAAQKDALAGKLERRLTTALGLGAPAELLYRLGDAGEDAASATSAAATATRLRSGLGTATMADEPAWLRWLPWLMGVGLPLALLLSLAPRCSEMPAHASRSTASASTGVAATGLPVKVYFESGSADPDADGAAVVESVAAMLVQRPGVTAVVTGFSDQGGNADINAGLAKQRAMNVVAFLRSAGVPPDRIELRPPRLVEIGAGDADAEARRVDIALSPSPGSR